MSDSLIISALKVKQPVGDIFVGVLDAQELLKICEFEFRKVLTDDSPDVEFMGIQRPYNEKRVKEIAAYVKTTDATFPTAIVISIDDRCTIVEDDGSSLVTILVSDFVDEENEENSVPLGSAARIIDGQHRLKGLEEAGAVGFQVPVTIFLGATDATRASVFSTVNLAQSKVNKSLVYDLFAVAQGRSPQKTAHEIVVALDSAATSPFKHRIKRLGTATRTPKGLPVQGRENELLSQATVVRGILKHISRNVLADLEAERKGKAIIVNEADKKSLVFRHLYAAKNDTAILINIANFFNAVKETWGDAWDDYSEGNMLNRTNGFDGLMRFLGPAYFALSNGQNVVTKADYLALLKTVPLKDGDFNVGRFPPGTSGASGLYKELSDSLEKYTR